MLNGRDRASRRLALSGTPNRCWVSGKESGKGVRVDVAHGLHSDGLVLVCNRLRSSGCEVGDVAGTASRIRLEYVRP